MAKHTIPQPWRVADVTFVEFEITHVSGQQNPSTGAPPDSGRMADMDFACPFIKKARLRAAAKPPGVPSRVLLACGELVTCAVQCGVPPVT